MSFDASQHDQPYETLAQFAKTRDASLRQDLVAAHLGLAEYLARRFANRGEPLEDLVQVALLGLIDGAGRFDPASGVEFSSFATETIVGELRHHFQDKGRGIKKPRRMQELYLRLATVVTSLGQRLGRSPTIAELAAEAEVSEEEVLESLEAGQAYVVESLKAPGPRGRHEADSAGDEEPGLIDVGQRAALSPLLRQLPPRQQAILYLRFFAGLTRPEIGARLGMSQMRVSRLLARCLAELRAAADG
jgi:RNA polymerase sigma-B factor